MLYWEKLTRGTEAAVSFHVLTADVAFTINKQRSYGEMNFPGHIISAYTKETHSFNFSDPLVEKAVSAIKKKDNYIEQLIEIRDYVNNSLDITWPTGSETKASDFLCQGVGRCYAHTIVFAALARSMHIPARAIGGLPVNKEQTTSGEHTRNQVYFPGTGWVDIDVQLDDGEGDTHSFNYFGFRSSTRYICFAGYYDEIEQELSLIHI